jgi:hypothetical protein
MKGLKRKVLDSFKNNLKGIKKSNEKDVDVCKSSERWKFRED